MNRKSLIHIALLVVVTIVTSHGNGYGQAPFTESSVTPDSRSRSASSQDTTSDTLINSGQTTELHRKLSQQALRDSKFGKLYTPDGRVYPYSIQVDLPGLRAKLPNLEHTAILQRFDTKAGTERQQTNVMVYFGKLSRSSFEAIKQALSFRFLGNISGVEYSPDREYLLHDFLTPVMQATLGHAFHSAHVSQDRPMTPQEEAKWKISGGRYVVESEANTNCWATAYEVARATSGQAPNFSAHTVNPIDADKIFTSAEYTLDRFGQRSHSEIRAGLDKFGAFFGDILIIRGPNKEILHSAVFIDTGLLYEKVGNESGLPYRLVRWQDIVADYPQDSYEVRTVKKPFPHIKDIPGVNLTPVASSEGSVFNTNIVVKEHSLTRGAGGYSLPPGALGNN